MHVCKPKFRVAIKTPRDHRAHTHTALAVMLRALPLLTHLKPVVPCKRRDKKGVIDDKEGWGSPTAHTPFHTGVGLSYPIKCTWLCQSSTHSCEAARSISPHICKWPSRTSLLHYCNECCCCCMCVWVCGCDCAATDRSAAHLSRSRHR